MISPQTLHFVKNEEGCRLKAYQDSRGIWTIGYGMTTLHSHPVKEGDVITQEEADHLFSILLGSFQDKVLSLVKVPITEGQTTALVSFAYNIGIYAFGGSKVRMKLNQGHVQEAADALLNWTRVGNNPSLLKARRERERSLFLGNHTTVEPGLRPPT